MTFGLPPILPNGKRQPKRGPEFEMPDRCPVCDGRVEHPQGEVAYRCVNPACPAKAGQRIGHFVSRGAFDIEGVGWALIEQLQARGLVTVPADLFFLGKDDLLGLDRFAEKSASNILERIAAARTRPLGRIVYALGIRHVGETTADDLARWLADRVTGPDVAPTFERVLAHLRAATIEELQAIPGVGRKIAASIAEDLEVALTKFRAVAARLG